MDDARARWDTIWDTLAVEEETLQLDLDATIVPKSQHDTLRAIERALVELPQLTTSREQGSRLTITKTIGQGGMGVVYLARQETIGREVAVKSVREERVSVAASRELLREAWITGRLEHPNIIPVHALGVDERQSPMFVMKRVEGVGWNEALHDPSRLPDFYSEDDPLDAHLTIFEQVCRAVHFAHSRNILHRDIKPENVMLGSFGEVYLVDWGIALTTETSVERSGHLPRACDVSGLAGTPVYMAPEMTVATGDDLGPWTDVYLLGATLHEVVTGQPRHRGKDLYSIMFAAFLSTPFDYGEDTPAELAAICARATAKETHERHPSAEALRQSIAAYRRHRGSFELAAQASRSLERLVAQIDALADSNPDDDDEALVYQLQGEVRFGFGRALEIWDENPSAINGMDRMHAAVFDFEIARRRASAAAAHLSQMRAPDEVLHERLRALRHDLDLERERRDELERMARDQDVTVSRRARAFIMFGLTGYWFTLAMLYELSWARGHIDHSSMTVFLSRVVGCFSAMALAPLIPRVVRMTRVNLQIVQTLVAALTMAIVVTGLCAFAELPPHVSMMSEALVYSIVCLCGAIFMERRVILGTIICLLGAFGALVVPDVSWRLVNFADLLTVLWIGWIWLDPQFQHVACRIENHVTERLHAMRRE